MVSSKALQSYICSQNLVLAGPSSLASHKQNHRELYQISASGPADKQVGHEYSKETSSEGTSGGC
ncbi:hypothetical protein F2Q69_00021931 [Brassica cretica]|uniref:Uncharacterized protein n=1 Tax=Brassica cretica TaxID=69181 RepID=A0A8S9Q9Z7_BRACR|nr:hypothetical protein F2Q69_00021931 [Brassica cretica]